MLELWSGWQGGDYQSVTSLPRPTPRSLSSVLSHFVLSLPCAFLSPPTRFFSLPLPSLTFHLIFRMKSAYTCVALLFDSRWLYSMGSPIRSASSPLQFPFHPIISACFLVSQCPPLCVSVFQCMRLCVCVCVRARSCCLTCVVPQDYFLRSEFRRPINSTSLAVYHCHFLSTTSITPTLSIFLLPLALSSIVDFGLYLSPHACISVLENTCVNRSLF